MIVDHSTTSPQGAKARIERARAVAGDANHLAGALGGLNRRRVS